MSSRADSEGTSAEQARQEFDRVKSEAGQLASSAADAARARGREQLDSVKRRTADRAEEIADAMDATADDMESGDGGSTVSGYGHSMAAMVRRFAGGLREQEIEEFAGQLAAFARRNPGSFLAGSVALGFGMSRFLKATGHRPVGDYLGEREEYAFDEDELEEDYLFDEDELEEDSTLRPSPSPEVSPYTAGEHWPEDRGNERPGAASPTSHVSPAASTSEPPGAEYSAGATGEPAAERGNIEGDAARRENLGGTERE